MRTEGAPGKDEFRAFDYAEYKCLHVLFLSKER